MSDIALLWPDDVRIPSSRDGTLARLGGRHLYFISRNLAWERPTLFQDQRAVITRHILENAGEAAVELSTHNIGSILARRPLPVKEKLERLLGGLAASAAYQQEDVILTQDGTNSLPYDLAREAGLIDTQELYHLLAFAHQEKLLVLNRHSSGASVRMTIPGLIHVQEAANLRGESLSAFVAMWFGAEMNPAFTEGMIPAIEANGYQAVRIDNREYNNKIDDEIISEIRRARFVVADFSCGEDGARGGVYFEAGFAMALGKPVIFTVRAADLTRVHFDTRQFNHIVWNTPEDLAGRLKNRIGATIGRLTDG